MTRSSTGSRTVQQLEQLRTKAVRLRLTGMKIDVIAQECGLSRATVIAACKAYKAGGWKAVRLKRRGRPVGASRALTLHQEARVLRTLLLEMPVHLSIPGLLWTTSAVRSLVLNSCGLELTQAAIRRYLVRWRLTSRRFSNKNQAGRENQKFWFETDYLRLQAKAYTEGFTIHFLNVITWQPSRDMEALLTDVAGELPGLAGNNGSHWILLRSLSTQGHERWKIYPGRFTTVVLRDFCGLLLKDVGGKIILVMHPTKQATSARIQSWLLGRQKNICFAYLPA